MNTDSGHVMRHPSEIPIEVQPLGVQELNYLPARNACLAELAFNFPYRLNVGEVVVIRIPSVNKGAGICGKVIWLAKSAGGYLIGVSFHNENEAFRMRMLEQICHIESYRKDVLVTEGRELSNEAAAIEWISCFAANFPNA